ncbi:uncharacterized protein TRIVIDRAFT_225173 [Trichoderma virens Gv29-8]|uniref:Uncharacterized protein n=1 Tax=Hypocrea virens (strain Gv29-8 / FGSC 10586) TaxID=413071 RepID=G9N2J2_HYPVG|nr:uncharacterized protein TRIVIDRAFT_225173 [Trichoderma virens Gv29-8]EHK19302.1 hypothetical protein TRIVIDRAFT_225173 [Trichoderma virens Gv29-8]UKZ49243.1 hypothetical protein TrVGV298_003488 [Trichoderma virens]
MAPFPQPSLTGPNNVTTLAHAVRGAVEAKHPPSLAHSESNPLDSETIIFIICFVTIFFSSIILIIIVDLIRKSDFTWLGNLLFRRRRNNARRPENEGTAEGIAVITMPANAAVADRQ